MYSMPQTASECAVPSPAPSIPTEQSRTPSMNLKHDDHAFVNIAMALLERYRTRNLNAEDTIDSVLLPHERNAFAEAVNFRKSQLPIFPVVNEDPNNQIVRDIDQRFGSALRSHKATITSQPSPTKFGFDIDLGSPTSHHNNNASPGPSSSPAYGAFYDDKDHSHQYPTSTPSSGPIPDFRQPTSPSSQQYQRPPSLETPQQSPQHQSLYPNNHVPARVDVSPYHQSTNQNILRDSYQQQHYHHYAPSNDDSSAAMSAQQHLDHSYQSNRSPAASSLSVETQPIQNLSHRERYNPAPPQNRYHPPHPHHYYQPFGNHGMGHQDTNGGLSPIQGATQPRYKLFRPPALQIQQPPVVPVTSPPTHIDIDWNILVKTVNEGIPTTHETKEEDSVDLLLDNALVTAETTCKSPDWASPTTAVAVATGTGKQGHEFDPNTSTPQLAKKDDNYLLEIARNKCLFIFDEAEATNKSMELRKNLLDEIDRVSLLLQQLQQPPPRRYAATGAAAVAAEQTKGMLEEKKRAYESYRTELRIELEKWNRASYEFRNHNNTMDGTYSGSNNAMKETSSSKSGGRADNETILHQVANGTTTRTGRIGIDDSKNKPLLPQTNDTSNQFPDTRKQLRFMKVVAPSTLPAGFQFEARIGDEHFVATVPPGGVTEGEVFSTVMGDARGDPSDSSLRRTRIFRDMDAPPSRWRDELFDCLRHGLCHDFLCNTIFCPQIALSQIMARIQLSDTGDPVTTIKSRTRVGWYLLFYLLLIALHITCGCFLILTNPEEETILMVAFPLAGLDVILILYFLCMVMQTRKTIRQEYGIPELRCHGHEDCCLTVFCTCCTISQMGRHTADYETYQSYCCTDTGLANHVEVKLPCENLVDIEQGQTSDQREYSTYRLI